MCLSKMSEHPGRKRVQNLKRACFETLCTLSWSTPISLFINFIGMIGKKRPDVSKTSKVKLNRKCLILTNSIEHSPVSLVRN
jgi:hypothetical protein